jgi:hypothetical protein
VSTALRVAMARAGLRDPQVYKAAGIPRSTWSRRMKDPDSFTLGELRKIADALDVELPELMSEAA